MGAAHTQPYVHQTATLGITGARRAMTDMVAKFSGMKLVAFDDMEQAKDWLIQA